MTAAIAPPILEPTAISERLEAATEDFGEIAYFANCGHPPDAVASGLARDYLLGLGLYGTGIEHVASLADALRLIRRPGADAAWNSREDSERGRLTRLVDEAAGQSRAAHLLNRVMHAASEAATGRAANLASAGDAPEGIRRAAAGAVIQAAYEFGLARAAEEPETHPFVAKFNLFRAGRWPLAVIEGKFYVY